jgi:hypothetical protein
VKHPQCFDRGPYLLTNPEGARCIGVGKNHDEFFAAIASNEIAGTVHGPLHGDSDGAQAIVAHLMSGLR